LSTEGVKEVSHLGRSLESTQGVKEVSLLGRSLVLTQGKLFRLVVNSRSSGTYEVDQTLSSNSSLEVMLQMIL